MHDSALTVFLSRSDTVATWPDFPKKTAIICFETLLDLLNFAGRVSPANSHTEDCYFISGSYWYTYVSSPVTMLLTRSDLSPSNFRSILRHHSILALFCSSDSWWCTKRAQRFPTQRWHRKIMSKLPEERFRVSFISSSVIRAFSLIRVLTPFPFPSVVTEICRPQRSLSSNDLLPNWNSLNHF